LERTFQCLGDEDIPRGEVDIEPAMRETSVLHEFSHAERIDAMLAYLSRGQFQDLLVRPCLFCLGMPHCPDLQRESFESASLAWVCMLRVILI
jgi:hypothetical protein